MYIHIFKITAEFDKNENNIICNYTCFIIFRVIVRLPILYT